MHTLTVPPRSGAPRAAMSLLELTVAMLLAGLLLGAGVWGMSAFVQADAAERSRLQVVETVRQAETDAHRDRRRFFEPADFDAGVLEPVTGPVTAAGQLSVAVSSDGLEAGLAAVSSRGRCVTATVVFADQAEVVIAGGRDVDAGDCDGADVLAGM